jgi:DNA-directed RNA polymerase subunit M/transcription elongation factor TFIIS
MQNEQMESYKFNDWNAAVRNAICTNLFKQEIPDLEDVQALLQKIKSCSKGNLETLIAITYEAKAMIPIIGLTKYYSYLDNSQFRFGHPSFEESLDLERKEIKKIETPLEVDENSMYMCSKCKGRKTMFYSRQVRRSDEPPTVFIFCMNKTCKHTWTEN